MVCVKLKYFQKSQKLSTEGSKALAGSHTLIITHIKIHTGGMDPQLRKSAVCVSWRLLYPGAKD